MWDERYSQKEYAYGEEPNLFLKEQLLKLPHGKILFPAEGEGRNAVYAAKLNWHVSAFDTSSEAKKKADFLAQKNKGSIDYQVGELQSLKFQEGFFDAIALVYAHFPAELKSSIHLHLAKLLKVGGVVIFEAFSKNHLPFVQHNPKVGGPKSLDMLFSIEELQHDFQGFEFLMLEEKEIELHEGLYHNGVGSVIRFVAQKK